MEKEHRKLSAAETISVIRAIRGSTFPFDIVYFPISTSPTMLRALSAITIFPSRVVIIFRTTPPPAGIAQLWNFSVFGSKRTSVFGLTADSLYQIAPLRNVIPYGCDLAPLGDNHSLISPVFGLSRPR